MKKIFSLVLCFTLVLSIAVGNISFAAEDVTTEELTEVVVEDTKELLIAKGLGFIDANVKGDDKVTRAQLAYTVANMIGLGEVDAGEEFFEDVKSTSSHAKAINILGKLQIFNGNGAGMFLPDEPADKNAIAAVFVRALGYDVVATQNGGWATGYLTNAQKIGLFDGVNVNDEMNMTSFARIVYNAMHTEIMGMKYSSIVEYEVTDNTILDLLNIVEMRGVVTANGKTGLTGYNNTSEGRIRIGNHTLVADDEKLQNAIGKSVQVYYQEIDGFDTIIYWGEHENDVIEINLDDVNMSSNIFTSKKVEYFQDNGKERAVNLEDNFALLYNDVYSDVVSMTLINEKDGYLELIDNDRDGVYEVIKIYVYTDYLVNSANEDILLIGDKFERNIDLSDSNINAYKIVDDEGKMLDWSAFSEWTVISLFDSAVGNANSSNRYIRMVVSKNAVSGTISGVKNDGGKTLYEMNNVFYEKSNSYVANTGVTELQSGLEGIFYLNAFDEICGFSTNQMVEANILVGIVVKAAYVSEKFSDDLRVKLFTDDNEMLILTGAEKIEIDGEIKKGRERFESLDLVDGSDDDVVEDYLLIRYRLNSEGELAFIDTRVQTAKEPVDSLRRIYSFSMPALRYRNGPKTFSRLVNVVASTNKFSVPSDPSDDDAYSNDFSVKESQNTQVEAYATSNIFAPVAILVKDAAASSLNASSMHLVTEILTKLDEDNNTVAVIETYNSQGVNELIIDDSISLDNVAIGDVIAVGLNSKGYVNELLLIYDRSEDDQLYEDTGFESDNRVFSGTVYNKNGSLFSLARTGIDDVTNITDGLGLQQFNLGSYTAYVCEETRNGMQVRKAEDSDLLDYNTYDEKASFIVGSDYADYPRIIFIYK